MDLSGGILVAGDGLAWGGDKEAGAVYVFDLNSQSPLYRLVAENAGRRDRLGDAVATDGVRVLAGTPGDSDPNRHSGSAHIFAIANGEYVQKLTGSLVSGYADFGRAAAIDGHRAAVGAYDNRTNEPYIWKGAVYVYNTASTLLDLRLTGDCPGILTMSARNATPGGDVAFFCSRTIDFGLAPEGACSGTLMSVGRPFQGTTPQTVTADAMGMIELPFNVPSEYCGELFLQAVDLTTCQTSNVLRLE